MTPIDWEGIEEKANACRTKGQVGYVPEAFTRKGWDQREAEYIAALFPPEVVLAMCAERRELVAEVAALKAWNETAPPEWFAKAEAERRALVEDYNLCKDSLSETRYLFENAAADFLAMQKLRDKAEERLEKAERVFAATERWYAKDRKELDAALADWQKLSAP